MSEKQTYVVRFVPQAKVEEHPVLVSLDLTDDQKELVKQITGKEVTKLDLTAIELNQIVDAIAFSHGSTVGASY